MKVPKVKKRQVSLHSRAARRGATPPPKDLAVKAPADETEYKPWLHHAQNAGISKKKKGKQLTRQQKVRQQRALEKAGMTVSKLERKVAESKLRAKKIQARAKDWDELNQDPEVKQVEKREGAVVDAGPEVKAGSEERKMEDVQLPDMEQLLPTRTAEEEAARIAEAEKAGHDKGAVDEVT